jgi:large subunit ribosomal protein L15
VSLSQLNGLGGEEIITVETLVAQGIVKKGALVKVLANGEVTNALKVHVDKISKVAQSKIESAGGKVIIGDQKEA